MSSFGKGTGHANALKPDDSLDIPTLMRRLESGELDPTSLIDGVLARIDRYPDTAVWIDPFPREQIDRQLAAATARKSRGEKLPLFGIPFSIKDTFDYAGRPTTAACPAFAYTAKESATSVQRLLNAGAIAIGKTNLDQFATGLVGTRSPYGACRNPFNAEYISGGSSSGSAVAVAAGLVSFSLATDTAGSGRVPAAFNNIIGFKPTRGLLSTRGLVPACRTLDCVALLSLTCHDARIVFDILKSHDPADPYSRTDADLPRRSAIPRSGFRFGVPRAEELEFFGNADAESLYHAAIERMRSLGGESVTVDYAPFARTAAMLYDGPWVVERYLAARELVDHQPDALHPVTRSILARGPKISAAEVFEAIYRLEAERQASKMEMKKIDLLLLPTAGTIYTISQVESDPIQLNTNLGRYTNFVNLLDMCAISVPGGFQQNGLPMGVSLVAPAGQDYSLLDLADAMHRSIGSGTGVGKHPIPATERPVAPAPGRARIAVVGAHLSGMPLNHQLTELGASLLRPAKTAPRYRLYALPGTTPPKPGLIQVGQGDAKGFSIELEIWEVSSEAFGRFVSAIPAPLGIGTIKLDDGQTVQGFLCEAHAIEGATDISTFGGWRAYMNSRK